MFKVTIKGLLQHKIRFLLTTFAVVAGVAFVVASFTLTDSVRAQFDRLFREINANIDLTIRAQERFDTGAFGAAGPVPADLLPRVQEVPGVAAAQGSVTGLPALVIDPEGKAVVPSAGPPLGVSWPTEPSLSQVILTEGAAPSAPDEVAFDERLYDAAGYLVGDTVTVQTPSGNRRYQLVGIFKFGEANALAGAYLVAFTLPEAQSVFNLEGRFADIEVKLEPGADAGAVRERIAALLPPGYEVVETQQVVEESQADLGSIIDVFGTVLLAFALISLFVAGFLIFNVFLIVVGQRIREMALLRAVGASSVQVAGSVLGEALVLGVLASVLGFFGGLVLASLLNLVLSAGGFGTEGTQLVVSPAAVIAAFAVGIGTTLLASVLPALWSTRIPPVAAMREGFRLSLGSVRLLGTIGVVLIAAGAATIAWGLLTTPDTVPLFSALGAGALVVFIGVALVSAAVAGPVARLLGLPFRRVYPVTGELARQNAAREPSRTAFTAGALMIGLALVSMSFVVGFSLRDSFVSSLRSGVSADWYVRTDSFFGFSPEVAQRLRELPELRAVSSLQQGRMQVAGSVRRFSAMELSALPELIDLDVVQGSITDARGVLISEDAARELGVSAGDTITVVFQETGPVQLPVLAVYGDAAVVGDWVIDSATYRENFTDQTDVMVIARTAPGVSRQEARAAIEAAVADYPQLKIEDSSQFVGSQASQLDQLLAVITVFLLLAVFIAVIGIVTTLALSVFERTRELGLLRAVGMLRPQVRRMIRLEAVIIAVFGALLGVTVGVIFGVVLSVAIPDNVISTITVPVGWLAMFVVLAAGLGVLAALYPAWRAGRLNVLEAIATE
ncbi:MAG: FtsX-like permease family protein [Acidimicrobiales bacterium]